MNKNLMRRYALLFVSLLMFLPFQNCNPVGSSSSNSSTAIDTQSSNGGGDNSGGGNNPPPPPPPPPPPGGGGNPPRVCQYSTNADPSILSVRENLGNGNISSTELANVGTTITINHGMDVWSGSDYNSVQNNGRTLKDKIFRVFAKIGGGSSGNDERTWQSFSFRNLTDPNGLDRDDNGNNFQLSADSSQFFADFDISIDHTEAECRSGNQDISFNLREAITAPACNDGLNNDDIGAKNTSTVTIKLNLVDKCRPEVAHNSPDGGYAEGQFGAQVAVNGNYAIASEPGNDRSGALNVGAAYIFVRSGSNWSFAAKIQPSELSQSSKITGVDIEDNGSGSVTAVIGTNPSFLAPTGQAGAVYVYRRGGSDAQWVLTKKLVASSTDNDAGFGGVVAINNNSIVTSAVSENFGKGAVYVYNTWNTGTLCSSGNANTATCTLTESTKISAPAGATNFGLSLDIFGNAIAIGSYDITNHNNGRAFLANKAGSILEEVNSGISNSTQSAYGASVALSSNRLIVGAPHLARSTGGQSRSNAGSAFIYTYNSTNMTSSDYTIAETGKNEFFHPELGSNNYFGSGVSIDGNYILVGARSQSSHGATHIYRTSNGSFVYRLRARSNQRQSSMHYGEHVSLSGNTALIAAPVRSYNSFNNTGSIYFSDLSGL